MCNRGVGVISVFCTSCSKWRHKRCTGLNSLAGITGYTCPVLSGTQQPRTWTDESKILDSATVEEVSEFCFLGDLLHSEGGAERAVRHRISLKWFKWRELRSLVSNATVPLKYRARANNTCMRSTILYGA